MANRNEFLRACTLSDLDCLDQGAPDSHQPRARMRAWPSERHSCDFCNTFASIMSRCVACERWLGLSDCGCAERSCQRTSRFPAGSDRFAVVAGGNGQIRCHWCATNNEALSPPPCGRSMGLLRRIVFVLEPTPSVDWRFRVAHRLLDGLRENADAGTILLYSFESADDDEWTRAMRLISAFAANPRLYLPDGCRYDDSYGAPRISVLLATHSTFRLREREPVRLETRGKGVGHTLAKWLDQVDQHLFADKAELVIDEFYLVSCSLFPEGAVGAANARRLSALADKRSLNVMACDGDCIVMLQIGSIAAEILASTFHGDPLMASPVRRFQPHAATIRIEPVPAKITLLSIHATQIDRLVQHLTLPVSGALTEIGAAAAQERMTLLSGDDEAFNRDVLLRQWPFRSEATAVSYEALFAVAAAIDGLQTRHGTSEATLCDWIRATCTTSAARSRIAHNVAFVAKRLARVGVLEREPLRDDVPWTLERAICRGLIVPPAVVFLRRSLDVDVFDAALGALQQAWRRMADERQAETMAVADQSARALRSAKRRFQPW